MSGEAESDMRPAVERFAREMEARLARHDNDRGRDGWKAAGDDYLMTRLIQEVGELAGRLLEGGSVICEATDVANFAMMLADNENRRQGEEGSA